MADNLLESYNPLYDVHLRQYFALPHMQKHLRSLGLLDGTPLTDKELHSGHVQMMDLMLRNRERVLQQLMDLQRKLDAAEKVELYRRIRSGITNADELNRSHVSRSLSRPARSAPGDGRRRRQSLSPEAGDLIKRVETDHRTDGVPFKNPKSIYNRLAANVYKYQYLHKLDDRTLHKYMNSLRKQLAKLERFREVSFGPHTMARHQPVEMRSSWFFRRRSLPSLASAAANPPPHQQANAGPRSAKAGSRKSRSGKSQSPRKVSSADEPPNKVQRTSVSRTRASQRLPPLLSAAPPKKRSFAASRSTPTPTKQLLGGGTQNSQNRLPPTAVIKPTARKAPTAAAEPRRPLPMAAKVPSKKGATTPTGGGRAAQQKGSTTPVPVQKPSSAASAGGTTLPTIIGAAVAGAAIGAGISAAVAATAEEERKKTEEEENRESGAPSPSISLAASQTTTTDGGQAGGEDSEWEAQAAGNTETRPTPEPSPAPEEAVDIKLEPKDELEEEEESAEGELTARASLQSPREQEMADEGAEAVHRLATPAGSEEYAEAKPGKEEEEMEAEEEMEKQEMMMMGEQPMATQEERTDTDTRKKESEPAASPEKLHQEEERQSEEEQHIEERPREEEHFEQSPRQQEYLEEKPREQEEYIEDEKEEMADKEHDAEERGLTSAEQGMNYYGKENWPGADNELTMMGGREEEMGPAEEEREESARSKREVTFEEEKAEEQRQQEESHSAGSPENDAFEMHTRGVAGETNDDDRRPAQFEQIVVAHSNMEAKDEDNERAESMNSMASGGPKAEQQMESPKHMENKEEEEEQHISAREMAQEAAEKPLEYEERNGEERKEEGREEEEHITSARDMEEEEEKLEHIQNGEEESRDQAHLEQGEGKREQSPPPAAPGGCVWRPSTKEKEEEEKREEFGEEQMMSQMEQTDWRTHSPENRTPVQIEVTPSPDNRNWDEEEEEQQTARTAEEEARQGMEQSEQQRHSIADTWDGADKEEQKENEDHGKAEEEEEHGMDGKREEREERLTGNRPVEHHEIIEEGSPPWTSATKEEEKESPREMPEQIGAESEREDEEERRNNGQMEQPFSVGQPEQVVPSEESPAYSPTNYDGQRRGEADQDEDNWYKREKRSTAEEEHPQGEENGEEGADQQQADDLMVESESVQQWEEGSGGRKLSASDEPGGHALEEDDRRTGSEARQHTGEEPDHPQPVAEGQLITIGGEREEEIGRREKEEEEELVESEDLDRQVPEADLFMTEARDWPQAATEGERAEAVEPAFDNNGVGGDTVEQQLYERQSIGSALTEERKSKSPPPESEGSRLAVESPIEFGAIPDEESLNYFGKPNWMGDEEAEQQNERRELADTEGFRKESARENVEEDSQQVQLGMANEIEGRQNESGFGHRHQLELQEEELEKENVPVVNYPTAAVEQQQDELEEMVRRHSQHSQQSSHSQLGTRPATAEGKSLLSQPSIEITPASDYGGSVEDNREGAISAGSHQPQPRSPTMVDNEEAKPVHSHFDDDQNQQPQTGFESGHSYIEHKEEKTAERKEIISPDLSNKFEEEEDPDADERTSLLSEAKGTNGFGKENGHLLMRTKAGEDGKSSPEGTEGSDQESVIIHGQHDSSEKGTTSDQPQHIQPLKMGGEETKEELGRSLI